MLLKTNMPDLCLEKMKWLVESGQDIADFKRAEDRQKFLDDRSKSNPNCVAYVRDQPEKREKSTHAKE
jgi:hypothetical protein